jgi:hypothetical protein
MPAQAAGEPVTMTLVKRVVAELDAHAAVCAPRIRGMTRCAMNAANLHRRKEIEYARLEDQDDN